MSGQRKLVGRWLPRSVYRAIERAMLRPRLGRVDFGDLRRLKPISLEWGSDRGQPIDRYYIERFLASRAEDIGGHVLEVGTDRYTRQFGGSRVTKLDVLHVAEQSPVVTILGDLESGAGLGSETFDCVILTQTLPFIFDVTAAVRTVERILVPGGTLLVTVPGISKISRYDMDRWGHHWAFTTASLRRVLSPFEQSRVEVYGNVLAAVAFLHGISADELSEEEIDRVDPDFQVLIAGRATKRDRGS
jgi:SAM-dependent methyltransferase